MAQKLKFNSVQHGMSYIYNVSSHVGAYPKCPNLPDDVELVSFLIAKVMPVFAKDSVALKFGTPKVTRTIDALTQLWIYKLQVDPNAGQPAAMVDGRVSPAHGMTYNPQAAWTIAILNFQFKKLFPDEFDNLPNSKEISTSLRGALQ